MGAVPALAEFDAAASGGAQTRLFPPPEDFALLALQQLANAMQVGSRQRNDALKARQHHDCILAPNLDAQDC